MIVVLCVIRYLEIIAHPMDLGTAISNLVEGHYDRVEELQKDIDLIASNCEKYWKVSLGDNLAPDLVSSRNIVW